MNPLLCALYASVLIIPMAGQSYAQDLRGTLEADTIGSTTGWYIRGDVGINVLSDPDLSQSNLTENQGDFISNSATNTASLGLGAGYRFNKYLRGDLTWELRTASDFAAISNINIANSRGQTVADIYSSYNADIETQAALVNAYVDLGTWNRLTPFVGASVGVARNRVSGLTGTNNATLNIFDTDAPHGLLSQLTEGSSTFANSKTTTNFAWGLTAGLSYQATENLTLEASARYLNLGDSATSDLINCTCGVDGQPLQFGDLSSIDVRVGMRWAFNNPPKRQYSNSQPVPLPNYNPVYK